MIGRRRGPALLLALGAWACRTDGARPAGGLLTARWTGADTSAFTGRAVAEWCAALRLLEIRAIAGDTGVGIALYPPGALESGLYPVRRPDVAGTAQPPSAAVGLRWFSQSMVMGFQGDSGSVTLVRRPDGSLTGRFTAGAHPLVAGSRLHVTGQFERLQVVTAPTTCAGRTPADSVNADSAQGGQDAGADSTD